jgi:predicted nucleotidyltransferase
MSPLRGLVTSKREQVLDVAARHHANRVRLFGSVARGDDRPDSDIDFLVDFSQERIAISTSLANPSTCEPQR